MISEENEAYQTFFLPNYYFTMYWGVSIVRAWRIREVSMRSIFRANYIMPVWGNFGSHTQTWETEPSETTPQYELRASDKWHKKLIPAICNENIMNLNFPRFA